MAMLEEPDAKPETALIAWAADVTCGTVTMARRLVGGNRRQAWAVDIDRGGVRQELFLRFTSGGGDQGADPYTLPREAVIYRALADSDVPIPRIIATHPSLPALLVQRVAGDSAFHRLKDAEQASSVSLDVMRALHLLHRIDARALALPGFGPVTCIADHVRAELAIWRGMYEETGRPDPLVELALQWLEANVPAVDAAPVLVHGDAGPGNFLFSDGRVTALIDWELSHLGDPVEDIAWLSMRTILEPFPDFPACIRAYETLSGQAVDPARLRYHLVFVPLRVVIIRHRALGQPAQDSDLANSLISRTLNRRLLIEALGNVLGVAPPMPRPIEAPPTEAALYFAFVLDQLRDVIAPRSSDPVVVAKTKSIARVIKYLGQLDRLGALAQEADRHDQTELLGTRSASRDDGLRHMADLVRQRRIDPDRLLAYLWAEMQRDNQIAAPVLGALANRHFPPVQ